jgi:isopenicillin-N N-acyltransferase like protein
MTHPTTRRDFLRIAAAASSFSGANLLAGIAKAAEKTDAAKTMAPAVEPDGVRHGYPTPQLAMPLVDCAGTAFECGKQLGCLWKPALILEEMEHGKDKKPWWKLPEYVPLIEKHCPHLPDMYRGMAQGANIHENALGEQSLAEPRPVGCTSFALAPDATLEGIPISGQNKDVSVLRGRQLVVLCMRISDAPSMLSMTYPGSSCFVGHGFVRGGTAIFRNSLYVAPSVEGLPYPIWILLALHCPRVDDVVELTRRHGVREAFHIAVADQHGGIVGIEGGLDGIAFLRPERGIYVHANAVLDQGPLRQTEKDKGLFRRDESLHRTERLNARLQAERGRLTAKLAYNALCDHDGYPVSVCRHQSEQAHTAAAVIVEPTRVLLHVTHGPPCQNWPQTYSLEKMQ